MKTGRLLTLFLICLPLRAYLQVPALDVQFGSHYTQLIQEHPLGRDAYLPHPGYSFGVHYLHPMDKRLSLRGGLRILSISYKTKEELIRWGIDFDPDTGLPKPNASKDRIQLIHHDRFIEVPVWLRYNFTTSRLRLFVELGLVNNLYINSENVSLINGQETWRGIAKDSRRKSFGSSAQVGFGVDYAITKRWGVFLQPYFRRDITPMGKIWGPYSTTFYVYGANVGGSLYLGKE